jgi:predicted nicotinamide N-methyase
MLSCKTYHVETSDGVLLLPKIIEFVNDNGLSIFTWPSSQVLSSFVASRSDLFRDLRMLELGAGNALPSIIAGMCGVGSVIITERCDEPDVLRNINDIIDINCLQATCKAVPLNWGLVSESDLDLIGRVDVVLGADVFYSSEAFDSVLLTFLSILSRDPHAVFYTTYQERRLASIVDSLKS